MKINRQTGVRNIPVLLFLIPALSILSTGCNEDGVNGPGQNPGNPYNPPVENRPDIMQTLQLDEEYSILYELLQESELSKTLSGSGSYTVFAPTDEAFEALPNGYLKGLTALKKLELLKYHLLIGDYPIINEIKQESIRSYHGDPIYVEIGQTFGDLLNNQARFVRTNTLATNGRIHGIDAVLIPDQHGSLAVNIKKRYEYRMFYDHLEDAGLLKHLSEPGNKTLLTTSDISLEWYGKYGTTFTDEQWKEIMRYHVLKEDISEFGPGTRMALATLSGDSVYLAIDYPGQYSVNGGHEPFNIVRSTNGIIVHSTGIMLPDKYLGVLPLIDKRYRFDTARAALAVAKLTGRLYNVIGNPDEQFTVFIAKDNTPGMNSLPENQEELAELFKYHILLEKVTSDQLLDGSSFETWQGGQIAVTRNGGPITLNGTVAIRQSDLIGANGVVHVIDRLLTLPSN